MEQNKVENYVVHINRTFLKDFAIWAVVLCVLLYASTIYDLLFYPSIVFAGYLTSNTLIILFTGLRIPGYQQALNEFGSDKEAKKAMIANYELIRASKPFALSTTKHLISVGVGLLCAGALFLAVITP